MVAITWFRAGGNAVEDPTLVDWAAALDFEAYCRYTMERAHQAMVVLGWLLVRLVLVGGLIQLILG